mgnify:CR=1 FL=1
MPFLASLGAGRQGGGGGARVGPVQPAGKADHHGEAGSYDPEEGTSRRDTMLSPSTHLWGSLRHGGATFASDVAFAVVCHDPLASLSFRTTSSGGANQVVLAPGIRRTWESRERLMNGALAVKDTGSPPSAGVKSRWISWRDRGSAVSDIGACPCCASSWPGTGPGPTSRESCAPCSESFLLLRPREVECLVLLGGEFCPHCEGLWSLGVC